MRQYLPFVLFVLTTVPASAQDAAPTRYVIPQSTALRGGPGGGLLGSLQRNTPVTVKESVRDWVHVSVDAWVRQTELADHELTAQSATVSNELQITAFSIVAVDKDKRSDPSKVLLKIQVQNNTVQPLSAWSGTIVMENSQGKPVFRTPLEGGPIKAKGVGEFNFYYDESEPQYAPLSTYTGDAGKLTVNLSGVKTR